MSSKKNGTLMNYTPPDPRVKTVTPEIGSSFICGSCGLETDSSPPISLLDMGAFIMSVLSHHHLSLSSLSQSHTQRLSRLPPSPLTTLLPSSCCVTFGTAGLMVGFVCVCLHPLTSVRHQHSSTGPRLTLSSPTPWSKST